MKNSTETSIKNDSFLARHFYKKAKTNTTNFFDPSILMVLLWSIALTTVGFYSDRESTIQEWHTQLADANGKLDVYIQDCSLSEAVLALKINVAPNPVKQKDLPTIVKRKVVAKKIQSASMVDATASTPRPKAIAANYTHHVSYQTPKLQRVIVKKQIEEIKIVREQVKLPVNYATDVITDTNKKEKLAYVVKEEILPLQMQAAAAGKLVVLSFGAKWCLPCKQMEKHTYPNTEIQHLLSTDYIWKKIDIQDISGYALQQYYDVKMLPSTLIINGKGKVIGRFQKGLSVLQMRAMLEQFQQPQYRSLPKLVLKDLKQVQQLEQEAKDLLTSVKAGFAKKNIAVY